MKSYFTLLILLLTYTTGFSQVKSFRTNLYIVPDGGGSPVLMDGTLSFFDNSYSNAVDNKDARKMFNPGENWGINQQPYVLIVERRQDVNGDDTVHFKIWNTRIITYRIEMIPKNFSVIGLSAKIVDQYLKTETHVSLTDSSHIDFRVTADANSARTDRFLLVFGTDAAAGMLPLHFVKTNTSYENDAVILQWQTASEQNLDEYVIEKSSDGTQFTNTALSVGAMNTSAANYQLTDNHPYAGANYYRIKAVDKDGRISYSDVMKVLATNVKAVINLFPNPANTSNIRLRFSGQQAGDYTINIVNSFGIVMHSQNEKLTTAGTEIKLSVNKSLPTGIYHVDVIGPEGYRSVLNLMIR